MQLFGAAAKWFASKWYWIGGLLLLFLGAALWLLHLRAEMQGEVPERIFQLQPGNQDEWKAIGGDWKIADGMIYSISPFRGAKLVTGSSQWRNYTLHADLRFAGEGADMGVMVRSNYEKKGVDTYNGYFIGLRTVDDTYVIGHSNFGWTEAHPLPMPGGVKRSIWYRMTVTA